MYYVGTCLVYAMRPLILIGTLVARVDVRHGVRGVVF